MGSPFQPAEHAALRLALPGVHDAAFLNAGSVGPVPQASLDAQAAELAREGRIRCDAALFARMFELQPQARACAARLTGAREDQVALMHSTHEGINACVLGLDLQAGDSIVTTTREHPAVYGPLRVARDRHGAVTRQVDWPADPAAFIEAVTAAVDSSTRAVIISHVGWMDGEVAPLRELAAAIGDVPLVVDGAQGAGALPVDAADGWAAYTVSGQKWPGGPHNAGSLVLAEPDRWASTYAGFALTGDFERMLDAPYTTTAQRLEQSQEGLLPLAGITASLTHLLDRVGVERAAQHSSWLNAHARAVLGPVLEQAWQELTGEGTESPFSGRHHLLACRLPLPNAPAVAARLETDGFVTRALGSHVWRVSLGYWNTPAELDALAAALAPALRATTP